MTRGPYSQFITIRHYQLIIRELYSRPNIVLPVVFNHIVLGSDIAVIQEYVDNILGTKPEDTITPPDIFNSQALLTSVNSGSFEKFKWMFANYQIISLIYAKQDDKDPTIFNSPVNLQYFSTSVIRVLSDAETKTNNRDGIRQILDWLLFSQNTPDDKSSLQEWVINQCYYNTRAKMDYKEIYLSCCACQILDLAQQILSVGLIPPEDIQIGQDILQPSFRAGMIAGNSEFLDFIISVDARNGEWLQQGRENNFSELILIIRNWKDKPTELETHTRAELLAWYLQRYFQKYLRPSYTNEEIGMVNDFIDEVVGLVTPELWQVLTNHFSGMLSAEKYKLMTKRRLICALGKSNVEMSKLLLAELLMATGETDSNDWIVHIPSETLIEICSGRCPEKDLAMLDWLWCYRANILADWKCVIISARSWIKKYYLPNLPSPLSIINWIWNTICRDAINCSSRAEFAENLSNNDCWEYINRDTIKITELCIGQDPQLVPKIWKNAVMYHRTEVCEFLFNKYPEIKHNPNIPKEDYFRGLLNLQDFSCWALEAFPHELSKMTVDMAYELITQQNGQYYKPHSKELAKILALIPFSGDMSAHGNYLFHYTQRMVSATNNAKDNILGHHEWLKVLYKICMTDSEKYSVILDLEQPNDLTRAQFELVAQYTIKLVCCVEQCPICQASKATLITNCGHQFCGECITQWFNQQKQNHKNCPYCRTNNPELYKMKQWVSV